MKKTLSVLCALLCAFSLFSCGKDSWVPAGMKLVSTDAVDYTMYVPEDWTVDISTGVVSAYVSNTDRSNVTMAAFNLSDDNSTMTALEYWDKYEADLIATFPDMQYISPDSINGDSETTEAVTDAETSAETDAAGMDSTDTGRAGNPVSTVLDNVAAYKYYYTATVTGSEIEYMQLVAVRGGVAYILTYTSTPANFSKYLEDIEKIITNFSFND